MYSKQIKFKKGETNGQQNKFAKKISNGQVMPCYLVTNILCTSMAYNVRLCFGRKCDANMKFALRPKSNKISMVLSMISLQL